MKPTKEEIKIILNKIKENANIIATVIEIDEKDVIGTIDFVEQYLKQNTYMSRPNQQCEHEWVEEIGNQSITSVSLKKMRCKKCLMVQYTY